MPSYSRAAVAVAVAIAVSAAPAAAQSVRLIGDYRDWSAYSALEGSAPLCFAMSRPIQVNPVPDGFTEGYLYITNRPGEGISNEFNLVAGFSFAPDQPGDGHGQRAEFRRFSPRPTPPGYSTPRSARGSPAPSGRARSW